jgi:glycine/D-amino acid oxidase-like deaminating enzyme
VRVIVIGGGIMGLSTAFALHRSGHRVNVYEQGPIPNPMGSSVDQHRLIRHPYGPMRGYAMMINPALDAWNRMWNGLGRSFLHPTGTLVLARDDLSWAEQSLQDMKTLGIPFEQLTAERLSERAPMLRTEGIEFATWVDSGGVLLASNIVQALASHLLMGGATVNTHTPVIDIDPVRSSITLEDGSRVRADAIVVACGPWVRALCPPATGGAKPSRQVVIYLDPPADQQTAWESAPMLLDIHGKGGIYAVPPVAGTGLKVGDHSFSLKGHPDRDREVRQGEAEALMEACRVRFKAMEDWSLNHAKTCFYTVQKEERFVLESIEKAVVMTGFSGHGFKFGAMMGELATGLITGRIDTGNASKLASGIIEDIAEIEALTNLYLG